MKYLIILLTFLWSIELYSQSADSIDFKSSIMNITNDSTSKYYYPKLKDKIKKYPSEISTEDCYYLYYGQIFQKDYKPLSFKANPERADFDKAVMNGNCKKAFSLGISILNRNPVDLTVLLHACNCIKEENYTDTTYFLELRFKNLLDAIFSSGDGKSMKSAIKIVNMEDDYILKGVLGFLGGKENLGFENNRAYSIWEKNGQKLYFEDVMNVK